MSSKGKSVPLLADAVEIVQHEIQGELVESGIDAHFVAWKALKALKRHGWTIMKFPDMPDEAPDPGGSGPTGF